MHWPWTNGRSGFQSKGGPHFVIQENELLIHTAISVFGAMLSAL